MTATFIWLLIGIKLPLVLMGVIIWRVVREAPDASEHEHGGGDGGQRHPRRPRPRPPRRGPHGDPAPAGPRRVRTVVIPAREHHKQ